MAYCDIFFLEGKKSTPSKRGYLKMNTSMKKQVLSAMLVAAFVSMAAPAPGSNAERVLDRLKKTAESPNYYWASAAPSESKR